MFSKREWLFMLGVTILSMAAIAAIIAWSVTGSAPNESGSGTPTQRVPEDWYLIETEHVTFYLPPQWQWHDLENFDTEVGEITYQNITLVYDYGVLAGPARQENGFPPEYNISYIEINGRKAWLVEPIDGWSGIVGVFFGNLDAQETVLNIYSQQLRAYSALELDTIFQIFATIRFK